MENQDLELHLLIDDSMVLQQGKEIRIFGKTEKNTKVEAVLLNDITGDKYESNVVAKDNGIFILTFPKLSSSFQTYTLQVFNNNEAHMVRDILIGEVWMAAGQSNMEMKVHEIDNANEYINANNNHIRIFSQKWYQGDDEFSSTPNFQPVDGRWYIPNNKTIIDNKVDRTSAIGYIFACELYKEFLEQNKEVPVGVICTARGDTAIQSWLPRYQIDNNKELKEAITKDPEVKFNHSFLKEEWNKHNENNVHQPSALFNQVIAPLVNYSIKGVLWYQGESDCTHDHELYNLSNLLDSWNKEFKHDEEDINFVLFQLAAYDGNDYRTNQIDPNFISFRDYRQMQFNMINKYDNAVLVPIYDQSLKFEESTGYFEGEAHPIHPVTKVEISKRAQQMAFSKFYNKENLNTAPMYDSYEIKNNKIIVSFKDVEKGLELFKGDKVVDACVVLKDNTYVNVEASLNNNKLEYNIENLEVRGFGYSYLSRNENSNIRDKNNIPLIPFFVEIGE